MMNESEFWRLVEDARLQSGGDCEEQFDKLSVLLSAFAAEDILTFHTLFIARLRQAYTWDLWAAAYIMNGGASDDGFEYFRAWLIGQGQNIYADAVQNADSLAAHPIDVESEAECEPLLYAPGDAYRSVTGMISPAYPEMDEDSGGEPLGSPWTEDDLPRRLPALFAKYN